MHRLMFQLVFVFVFGAGVATAQQSYTPPPVGTQITWSDNSGGETKTRVSEVVAVGSDFAIHLYNLGWDNGRASSYFAEFSGLHVVSCASVMPSREERDRLRALWPLQSGKTLSLEAPQTLTYEVGYAEEYTVSQSEGSAVAYRVKSRFGDHETGVLISLDLNTTVEMAWSDGAKDRAIDVFRKPSTGDDALDQKLGLCQALLEP